MTSVDPERASDVGDAAAIIRRADELAAGPLSGIEQAAAEVAALAGGDVAAISRARRMAAERADREPTSTHKQVVAIVRRAIEVGRWDWDAYERDHKTRSPNDQPP